MDKQYGFKLNNLVNNLKSSSVSNKIDNVKHTINYNQYLLDAKSFYLNNYKLSIDLAEENIVTIADLNKYIDWIKDDKQ